ncbi:MULTISPECIES: ATP-dependent zinc protease family protein [Legionella]|uniref:Secreted protein n=2 Tax=Legionella TaxID=445 RepID=A0A378KQ56_9GAMM|nr:MULTISPECIES: RimK/LysX family protein [Legionella]KTD52961.1 secreted protein [Legionella quateirensis]MBL7481482.1 ATP-dependent zinc protease [Legionella bononiensis]MBL7527514.1 ATP-dependent zinc protease [Legionella bononiensis]STY16309.1 secreted protein [Legionella quateirensis]
MRSILALFLFMSLLTGPIMAKSEVQIYGYVEKATLVDKNLTLSAKLDTGAKSASLNAVNITEIDVKGVPYLRFTVPTKNGDHIFECEYIGKVKIKVRASETNPGLLKSTPIKRPVVLLNVKLGDKVRAIQVNLTNRKRFLYPLLLGRDAIIDFDGAVDPALTFTLKSKSLTK